jgi:hypothetical protein
MPGKYTVTMALRVNRVTTPVAGSQTFSVNVEGRENMAAAELLALGEFQRNVGNLERSVSGAISSATDARTRSGLYKRSAQEAPVDNTKLVAEAERLDDEIEDIIDQLRGGRANTDIPPPSINDRIGYIAERIRLSTVRPSRTQLEQYDLVNAEFQPLQARLRKLLDVDLPELAKALDAAGAPLAPGQAPAGRRSEEEDGGDGGGIE